MPYGNPKEIVPDDFKALKSWSLVEEDGLPILHMTLALHPHREYDPEPSSLFLPSIDPRRLYPEVYPDKEAVEDTGKQEAVQAEASTEQPKSSKKSSKASGDSGSQDSAPSTDDGTASKAEDTAPASKTGQGG